ncbi:MAG: putative anti-sigma regulatory factor, serine/threonine protein kinase [Solirubrobacterales bacterium]|nr:putative anti-sigma regulatory factor, serine/threonine protein kinase [Solirubrobacterales bacterium]
MRDELRVAIESDADVVSARREARALAAELNFTSTDVTLLATAISEVARNITTYAGEGEIVLSVVHRDDRAGIRVEARDEGPGIRDVERAMEDGYSTGTGMGLGLPGARRLTDEFSIDSRPGRGTTVVMVKWGRPA